VLQDPARHAGRIYELTGPSALTLTEAAEVLTAHGVPARFEDETVEQAYASRDSYGAPDWEVRGWVTSYLAIRDGSLDRVTGDVERLTGHPARSLGELFG
jgi:uncharacterized protein YbjT (DUF2867 family)